MSAWLRRAHSVLSFLLTLWEPLAMRVMEPQIAFVHQIGLSHPLLHRRCGNMRDMYTPRKQPHTNLGKLSFIHLTCLIRFWTRWCGEASENNTKRTHTHTNHFQNHSTQKHAHTIAQTCLNPTPTKSLRTEEDSPDELLILMQKWHEQMHTRTSAGRAKISKRMSLCEENWVRN